MSKLPVHRAERAPRKVEQDVVEVMEPASRANPFFSFRYSYTEISASGGKARVKSRRATLRGWQTYLGGVRGRVGLQRLRADGERGATSVPCPDRVVDEVAVVVAAVFRETSSRPRLINSKQRCSLYSLRP